MNNQTKWLIAGAGAVRGRSGRRLTAAWFVSFLPYPGLMRTGSHVFAQTKGNLKSEFGWFSFMATNPLFANRMDARMPEGQTRAGNHDTGEPCRSRPRHRAELRRANVRPPEPFPAKANGGYRTKKGGVIKKTRMAGAVYVTAPCNLCAAIKVVGPDLLSWRRGFVQLDPIADELRYYLRKF